MAEADPPSTHQMEDTVATQLFKSRTVLITGEINAAMAQRVIAQLHALSFSNDKPILVVISSPGGHVESGDLIHDTIKFIKPRVRVLGSGWVASAGALIYVSADKGDRYALPNTRFLLHEPRGGVEGKAADIMIQAREIEIMRKRLNKLFSEATGQPLEKIEKETERDFWLSAEEAKAYGLVDRIITSQSEIQ
jgi:ATP-dependent Clp protease, protease subunit